MDKFFIVGCPRSGTTMVQQALNRHSGIAIPPETKYFFSFFGHSQSSQARHLQRLEQDLRITLPTPAGRITSIADGRAFYDLMAERYTQRVQKKKVVCFGEKTPEHTGHLSQIHEMFPRAKILVLYRDGRDVASSLSKVPWMSSNLYVNFLVWLYYCRVLRAAANLAGSAMYFARYEDIVSAPQKELGAILRFLELPYEQSVADGWGNREGIPEREYPWKERALEKITTDRIGVFRRELESEQIEILERLGRKTLSSLGYPLETDGKKPVSLGFLLKLSFHLSKFVFRLPWQSVLREILGRFSEASTRRPFPLAAHLAAPA